MTMAAREIRIRSWVRGTADEERSGLLGYLSIFYGDLVLDGITLRRTADGNLTLSFPARTDRSGNRHAYFRPVDDAARRRIEREILKGMVSDSSEVAP
jgi:hypothetical protein